MVEPKLSEKKKRIIDELVSMGRDKEYATKLVTRVNPLIFYKYETPKEIAEHLLKIKNVRREGYFREAIGEEKRKIGTATKKLGKTGLRKKRKKRRRR